MKTTIAALVIAAHPAMHHHHHAHHHLWPGKYLPKFAGTIFTQFKPPTSHPKSTAKPATPPPASPSALVEWQKADAIAVGADPAHPVDPAGHACYSSMVGVLQGLSPTPVPTGSQVTAVAQARVAKTPVNPKVGDAQVACAEIFPETGEQFLARMDALAKGAK